MTGGTTTVLEPEPGQRIVVERHAGAGPAFLFLHGMGSVRNGDKSEALRRRAARHGRAFARFDFRGHGQSTGEIGHVTMTELIGDAGLVLDLVGPAVLVGSSLGGLVAAHLAAMRPDATLALCLLSPAFGFLPRMRARLDSQGRMRTTEGFSFFVHERALADAATHDEGSLPGRLPMPLLVAHGDQDEVVPHQLSADFFAAVPHAHKDLMVVPGGDHRLNREIEPILDRLDALLRRHGQL